MDSNSTQKPIPAFELKLTFMDNTTASTICFGFQTTERVLILAFGGEEERFPLCNLRSWYVKPTMLRQAVEPAIANSGVNSTKVNPIPELTGVDDVLTH